MPAFLLMAQGNSVAHREESDTGDEIVSFHGREDSPNHVLSDNVVSLGHVGHIAMIVLESFIWPVCWVEEDR